MKKDKKDNVKKNIKKPIKQVKQVKKVKKLTKKEIQELKAKQLKEKQENYLFFNKINGYIPSFNIVINEKNDYILFLKVLNFNSMFTLIDRLKALCLSECMIYNYKNLHYVSVCFDKDKIYDSKKKTYNYKIINNVIKDIEKRKNEFVVLRLPEVFVMLKDKVYRDSDYVDKIDGKYIENKKIRNFIINKELSKNSFQSQIQAKNVYINKEENYITFNNNSLIKHRVLGFQMYPSFLYEGYLSEINNLYNVETSTYIKPINKNKCINVLNSKKDISRQEESLKEILEEDDKLYNTCFFIHIFGNDDELIDIYDKVNQISNKYHVILNNFVNQQKESFKAFLPLMNNKIKCYRAIDNINGILPYNHNVIKYFDKGLKYGYELISGNEFTYNRTNSGVLISSNKELKEKAINFELNDYTMRFKKNFYKVDFNDNSKYPDIDLIKFFVDLDFTDDDLVKLQINEKKLFNLFKTYMFLCLSYYKDNIEIDKNDKETLDSVFKKLHEKLVEEKRQAGYKEKVERIKAFLTKNNQKLYNRINKEFLKPDKKIQGFMKCFFKIMEYAKESKGEFNNVCYVYNTQEVVSSLDIFYDYIFKNTFNTIFLFTSENDFMLLNNEYVAESMVKAKYINIIDAHNNIITKIKRFLELPDDDVVHLNNKNYIAGLLYTDICEFNYYIEKNNNESEI